MKLLISLLFISLFTACNSERQQDTNTSTFPTYQEKRKSLAEIEQESPLAFLKIDGSYRTNLIGRWVLEGKISNTATTARYKDVVITITYYSKTDTELGSENKVFYDYFEPNSVKEFKIKVDGYGGTAKVDYTISSAKVAY